MTMLADTAATTAPAPAAPAHTVRPLAISPRLAQFGIAAATEFVMGRAVVVIAQLGDGTVGVGYFVHGRNRTVDDAREIALVHAMRRLRTIQTLGTGGRL